MKNNGYFTVNGEKIMPEAGDILVIEPNDSHTVTNDTDEDFRYMAFKVNYDKDDSYW